MQKNEDLSLARVITRVNSSQNSLLTCINNIGTGIHLCKKPKLVFWLSIHFVRYVRTFTACAMHKLKEYEANVSEILFTLKAQKRSPQSSDVSQCSNV
jgi:hypothetical protein